ncbi:MAG: type IX secretion system protein PorQ [Bacteroidales bacterium]|nr:type IX secretion system protein PorQ [Bacteroidales bacterium]
MLRKSWMCILLTFLSWSLYAQSGEDLYQFLNLPTSVSASGVGGNSVSSVEKDLNLTFHNPAILSTEMNNDFSVGYMHYISDINAGSVAYARKIDDKRTWMVGVRYVDYGSMLWTTAENEILGDTYAQDLALTGAYSWMLSEYWRAGGGVSLIYSVLDEYTSFAIAVDLGLYYNDPEHFLSAGFVLKNLGSQIVSYDGNYEKMPWDVQFGVSKKLAHAPFRFTMTVQNLNNLKLPYEEDEATELASPVSKSFATTLFRHLLLGVEFVPSDQFLLSLGYNYRRISELSINQRTSFGGFTVGFSTRVKNLRIGASYAKYHIAGGSLQMTLGMNMNKFGL